jgi:hypothetical protein
MFTEKQSILELNADQADSHISIHPFGALYQNMGGLTRSPSGGTPWVNCYTGARYCSCYEMQGCISYVGPGVPGISAFACPSVRDHAMRGGHGGVRIRFIEACDVPR